MLPDRGSGCSPRLPTARSRCKPQYRPSLAGRVRIDVGQLPLASIYPRRQGGCESGALTLWDDGAARTYPLSLLARPSWTFTARSRQPFEDGSVLVWTVIMTVKTTSYRRVDCARTQLC